MAFPTIPTTAASRALTAVQANTTAARTFPSLSGLTKNAGDLLIAIVVAYQGPTTANAAFTWPAGWTEFVDQSVSSGMAIGAAYKFSTGSETGTFAATQAATVTGHAAMILLSIAGAHASTPPEGGTIAQATGAAADPGSFDPAGWAAEDTLWLAVGGSGETSLTGSFTGIAGPPTNYSGGIQTGISADAIGGVEGAVAFRQLNAASEDVGTRSVDTSQSRNSALVIAVRPAAAAVPTQTDVARVSLATGGTPPSDAGHSIKARARKASGSGTVVLRAALYEGATNRSGDLETDALTTALTDYVLPISEAAAAAITDYSNLELRFWGYSSTSDTVNVEVAQVALEVPAAGGASLTQPLADAATITDQISIVVTYDRTIADSAGIADAITPAAAYQRALADTAGIADAITAATGYVRGLADTAGIADAQAKDVGKGIADTAGISDQLSSVSAFVRQFDDAAALTDLADPTLIKLVSINDSAGIADQISLSSSYALTLADSAGISDALALAATYLRIQADSAGIADAVSKDVGKSLADSAALTDLLTSAAAYARTIADTMGIADAQEVIGAGNLSKQIDDTASITDATSSLSTFARQIDDAAAISDALGFARTLSIADAISAVDGITPAASYLRSFADVAVLSDVIQTDIGILKAIADGLGITDSILTTSGYQRAIDDALVAADQLNLMSGYVKALADELVVSDELGVSSAFVRVFDDVLVITDLASPILFAGGVPRMLAVRLRDIALWAVDVQARREGAVSLTDRAVLGVLLEARREDSVTVSSRAETDVRLEENRNEP